MSGHSKWSQIKRKKAATDAKRGKIFSKMIREITVAARIGGGDPEANPRLRTAIERARAVSMPADNIKRAIDRATGGGVGANIEEVVYEGYGPGGVAFFVEAQTDNKNRTTAEVRHVFTKYGGNLGESGCVGYLFEEVGLVAVEGADEEALFEAAVEAGAEDVEDAGDGSFSVKAAPNEVHKIADALKKKGFAVVSSDVLRIPTTTLSPPEEEARKNLRLVEALEDLDDVSAVTTNLDVEIVEKFEDAA